MNIISCLYVPGNQKKKLQKSSQFNASVLIPDIEDSVPLDQKQIARQTIKETLFEIHSTKINQNTLIMPRINSLDTNLMEQDVYSIYDNQTKQFIYGFHIPKINNTEEMLYIHYFMSKLEKDFGLLQNTIKLIPSTESTYALLNLKSLLENQTYKDRLVGMMLGGDDFCQNFEVERKFPQDLELQFPRQLFALTCHAYGIIALDTPYVNFKNDDGLRNEISFLKSIGFKGKFAIHPGQINIINEEFSPSLKLIEQSQQIVQAYEDSLQKGIGAISYQGQMVDNPVYKRALKVLQKVGQK